MKRAFALATLLLCVCALGAAARPAGRTVEKVYEPATVTGPLPSGSIHMSRSDHVHFRTRAYESLVMVTIEDETGTKVPGKISYGDPENPKYHEFCGSTKAPVSIEAGAPIGVYMGYGSCDGEFGGWTTGTVTATFSR